MQKPLFLIQIPSSKHAPMQEVQQLWRRKFSTALNLVSEEMGEGALVIASSITELHGGVKFAVKSERYSTRPFIWLNPEEESVTYFSSPDIALLQVALEKNSERGHTGELPVMV